MNDKPSTKADLKALLAGAGQSLHPDAKLQLREKPAPGVGAAIVVLERVTAGYTPPYCVHGYASCVSCDAMCYLGSETQKMCSSGKAYAVCKPCADTMAQSGAIGDSQWIGNAEDHLRIHGPH